MSGPYLFEISYLLQRAFQLKTFLGFLILLKFKRNLSVLLKNISDEKEMTKNANERSETEFASVEDPLNIHRTASYETTLVSEIPNIINDKNVIIASGQGKKQLLFKVMNLEKSKRFHTFFLRVNLVIMVLEIFQ